MLLLKRSLRCHLQFSSILVLHFHAVFCITFYDSAQEGIVFCSESDIVHFLHVLSPALMTSLMTSLWSHFGRRLMMEVHFAKTTRL